MINDFTLKQSTIPNKAYQSKVLIGNWYEEKSDKADPNNYFYKEQKFAQYKYDMSSLTKEDFNTCSKGWLNFQNNDPKNIYMTTSQSEFKKPEDQKRNSVLKKFITKKDCFEKNPEMLEEYKKKWTQSNHVFERTYLDYNIEKKVGFCVDKYRLIHRGLYLGIFINGLFFIHYIRYLAALKQVNQFIDENKLDYLEKVHREIKNN